MVLPRRASVRPRVISAVTGDSLLLEEEVASLIERRLRGSIRLIAPEGWGKTTALEHLADRFSGGHICFLECPQRDDLLQSSRKGWVVFTTNQNNEDLAFTDSYCLAPWRDDECVEYLVATHKERCASVMSRLRSDATRGLLDGNPQLTRIVLDRLAAHDSISSARAALLQYIDEIVPDSECQLIARNTALYTLLDLIPEQVSTVQMQQPEVELLFRLLRHRAVQLVLAAAQIVFDMQNGTIPDYFRRPFPRDLVRQAAAALVVRTELRDVLIGLLVERRDRQAMVASLLHATGWPWSPQAGVVLHLGSAYLDHVAWPEVVLPDVHLELADLSHAELRKASLMNARLIQTDLRQADLREATLTNTVASGANLAGAKLSRCSLPYCDFDDAKLQQAELSGANLRGTSFEGATLSGASLRDADLRQAVLVGSVLDEADFSGANLEGANLSGLNLRNACFAGTCFVAANLSSCDMEGMELPQADFRNANLEEALLTGSTMQGACFDNARLVGAGLAEIDWERASLRGADLRGASFHLGSTRCGRVGSPIACEGSRTGFYTDDFTEQDFKSPEEIRKANLCHADLRGALIKDVDFYLVDLRYAQFDRVHEPHLRRCGAILEDRGERPA